jgi:hypothetical protein
MTPSLLQSEFRIKSYDHFIPDGSMLKSDPLERHLERALEQTVLLLTRSNGKWNGHWNRWFYCSPGQTANGTGIGTDGSVSHPVERKTPCSNEKLHK